MTLPSIDFSRIRPHAGSVEKGFEELCVQVFRRCAASSDEFRRVEGAGGDEGVEAYIIKRNGREIGLQSKWFKSLARPQWRQIDKSVCAAVKAHPRLVEYRIAVPLDRTPTQLKLWTSWKRKWTTLTKRRTSFVWLGKSELSHNLSTSNCRDLLTYWFGAPEFTDEWMDRVIRASLHNLDRRYSPKQHVETDPGRLADVFAWSPTFTEQLKTEIVRLNEQATKFTNALSRNNSDPVIASLSPAITSAIQQLFAAELPSIQGRCVSAALADADNAITEWENVYDRVDELARNPIPPEGDPRTDPSKQNKYYYLARDSEEFGSRLRQWGELLDRASLADRRRLLVLGEAGTGKSHLIASIIEQARRRHQPGLLLLGEQFTGSEEPWGQALRVMGWESTLEQLLSAMNTAGAMTNLPALVCVDAINESDDRGLWARHLNSFASRIDGYPFVRLIITCRSDFAEITLPPRLAAGHDPEWATLLHHGFGEEMFEAVGYYFEQYEINSPHFPPLIEEFRNPLFLRLFCEAFEGKELPVGPLTLERVMSARIETLTAQLQREIDCSADDVRSAIYALAHLLRENNGRAVDRERAKAAINTFSPEKKHSKSLYTHLRSSGILIEIAERTSAGLAAKVRFAFERFSDYFIADELLRDIGTADELVVAWKRDGRLAWLVTNDSYWSNRGLISALSILIPERFQTELYYLVDWADLQHPLLRDFLSSLPWRSAASFTQASHAVLQKSQKLGLSDFLQAVLRVATIPNHPYNADFLHRCLSKMSLPQRELVWTIPIARLTGDEASVASMVVTWAMRVPPRLVPDGQAVLVARVLAWMLSSNRQSLRKRATIAAIRILNGRAAVTATTLREFDDANDPYVVERIYAVACGVAMRELPIQGLRDLAAVVHQLVFEQPSVRPNILLRDYAQSLLEVAAHRDALPAAIEPSSFRPRFKSRWPRIRSERQVKTIENDDGWRSIVSSVRPEGMGYYGDFGRYVMGSAVHHFSNSRTDSPFRAGTKPDLFDARIARRFVLQRVKSLGWSPKKFGTFERNLPWSGRHEDKETKVERVSKKYQWIALHELLGYLSDHYSMRPGWNGEPPEPYRGAWQVWARDFDPSLPLVEPSADGVEIQIHERIDEKEVQRANGRYTDPFENVELCKTRVQWVESRPADFGALILWSPLVRNDPGEWVSLNGFWSWDEPKYQAHRLKAPDRLHMWLHIKSWLIDNKYATEFVRQVKRIHFWGHGCQGVSLGDGWIGEYPWGTVFDEPRKYCDARDEWIRTVGIRHTQSTCSWDKSDGYIVPSPQLCDVMSLRWAGNGSDFVGPDGRLSSFQTGKLGPSKYGPCVVRLEELRKGLNRAGMSIVWACLGERQCWNGSEFTGDMRPEFSGVYDLTKNGIRGGITHHVVRKMYRHKPG